MTVSLHALPYDITAPGFYFHNIEDFHYLAAKTVNAHGDRVEEFDIRFIDGEPIDAALARAFSLHQDSVDQYLKAVSQWDEDQKTSFIKSFFALNNAKIRYG